jgi:hypothetical protein
MVQSEAQKRAKAKYYAKLKEDPQYREESEEMARRQKEYYNRNKEKHLDTIKKLYQVNKGKIYEYIKEKRGQDKINSVVSKLENMSMEDLAKILIETKKTKLLEN